MNTAFLNSKSPTPVFAYKHAGADARLTATLIGQTLDKYRACDSCAIQSA